MLLKVAQMTLEGIRKKIMKVEERELGFKRWMPFFTQKNYCSLSIVYIFNVLLY